MRRGRDHEYDHDHDRHDHDRDDDHDLHHDHDMKTALGWTAVAIFYVAIIALFLLETLAHADSFVDEQIGVAITQAQVSCTGTIATAVAGGSKRAWTVINQSSVDVFVCMALTCTTSTGLRLQQNMGLTEQNYIGAVTCITAGSTATLGVAVR